MALDQQKTIILLVAILLAVVATSVAVLLLLPGDDDAAPAEIVTTNTNTSPTNFNTSVLERSDYRALDQRLVEENALPVQPPAEIGKANPFL